MDVLGRMVLRGVFSFVWEGLLGFVSAFSSCLIFSSIPSCAVGKYFSVVFDGKPLSFEILVRDVCFVGGKVGSRGRTRTCNPLVNSQLLYH